MSTKEYGCFLCSGKASDETAPCPSCGRPIDVSKELKQAEIGEYRVIDVLGRGFYGWTVKAADPYQVFAIKIVPSHRLGGQSISDTEARALAACSPHRNIARFIRQIPARLRIQDTMVDITAIVFEYVADAVPLRRFLESNKFDLSKSDVVDMVAGMASGLNRMHSRHLWHFDLHDDNILVHIVNPDENLPEHYEAKLIDFGSARQIREELQEDPTRCDYQYLAKHIYSLVSRLETGNASSLTPTDRAFCRQMRVLAHQLMDRDITRRNLSPSIVIERVRQSLQECTAGHDYPTFNEMISQAKVSLVEPLANTNALGLAPQDVALLFRDSLGWEERVKKSETVIIVGPRGCGKTMLLRYLSISSQARPQKDEGSREVVFSRMNRMPFVAFLISIGQMRTPFLRSSFRKLEEQNPALAEDFSREYFNANFAFEIARAITWLSREQLVDCPDDDVALLVDSMSSLLAERAPGRPGLAALEWLTERLDKRIQRMSSLSSPEDYLPTPLCNDDALIHLAKSVKAFSWASAKEIWFLLDDYSVTVIPRIAQQAYNPVLFKLSSDVRVKVSSEGDGPELTDSLGRKYVEGRELTKVNLGEVYFEAREQDARNFFEQILDARFRETNKGSLGQLKTMLGEHAGDRNFGKYILSQKKPGNTRFYGFSLICRLCSGDVSFIMELLHSIAKGRWDAPNLTISDSEQDDVIKRFAQRQLTDLRGTAEYGARLYKFAQGLGSVIKYYLLKTDPAREPDERLRIEIEGTEPLSPEAIPMHHALLRHSVLIPGGYGKSRKGLPTRKLYFRRLFAPCFPFSPTIKGCIRLTTREYDSWLLDPDRIKAREVAWAAADLFGGDAT